MAPTHDRALFLFDAAVLVGVGAMAFGGSASHVLALALANGQRGFGAWSVVALAEILFAYEGLEVRRRKGKSKIVPVVILTLAGGFIVWANLESTHIRTVTGYVIAVMPALAFAAVAITAETRGWTSGGRNLSARETVADGVGASAPAGRGRKRTRAVAAVEPKPRTTTKPPELPAGPGAMPGDETPRARRRAVVSRLGEEWAASQSAGAPLSRTDVARRLGVSPQRAGDLIRRWSGGTTNP